MPHRNPIPETEWRYLQPIVGSSMLELGEKRSSLGSYKPFFESLGLEHVSIDLNGKRGAIAQDLGVRFDLGRTFDMVTNFGTTEHCYRQRSVWENVLRHCEQILVSTTPYPGDWLHHGKFHPTIAWYRELAEMNDFVMHRIGIYGQAPRRLIAVRMRRVAPFAKFVMPRAASMHHNRHGKMMGVAE